MSTFYFLKKYLELFDIPSKAQNRKSILEPLALLAIKEHPMSSKADLTEIIFNDRSKGRSSLDKPINHLIEIGFVEYISNEGAKRKKGEGSKFYSLTEKGILFCKSHRTN